ncbi:MAG: type II secretion system F family protein [Candidatus Aenigmatarchaeota archaeon]
MKGKKLELNEKSILLISLILFFIILILASFTYQNIALFVNLIIIGVMVIILPYSIFKFIKFQNLRNCEMNFPNFLRDIAAAKRSGLTLIQAIKTCAASDYGALTPHVVRLNNQLSWNIPLKDALENFRNRLKDSQIISQSILAISQIEESGGKSEDILDSLADNVEGIKEAELEKSALMSQHIMAVYAIFFIFLGISIALIAFLLKFPQIPGTEELPGIPFGQNPCKICINSMSDACSPCHFYFIICEAFKFGKKESARCYYNSIFLLMIIIEGVFSGLIAGQIGSNSIAAGLKHSLIMGISGFLIFIIAAQIGII